MTKKRITISKEFLEENYVEQEKSAKTIAKELNCHYVTVCQRLKEYGITPRKDGIRKPEITKEFLEEEYKNKGTIILSKELGISQAAVMRRLRRFKIQTRSQDKLTNLKGKEFDSWTAIKRDSNYLPVTWICKCKCGNIEKVTANSLLRKNSTKCKRCAAKALLKEKHPSWKGCGLISGSCWNRIKASASKRDIEFNITIKHIWDLFQQQNGECTLTGWPIEFAKNCKEENQGKTTASLDRIDSSKGYIEGNVQWVHKDVNRVKTNIDQKRFIEICEAVSYNREKEANI